MEIKEIIDKNTWEEFVLSQSDYSFLNSWNWGEFNLKLGHRIWRLGIYEEISNLKSQISNLSEGQVCEAGNQQLVGVALVIKIVARRGIFLFLPHLQRPTANDRRPTTEIFKNLIDYLKELAKKENCSFIRISPLLEDNEENRQLFKNLGFRPAPIHMHAEIMWFLDLEPSEEKLLADMRKTTRYLVKKSEKEGVEIFQQNDIKGVEMFNNLYRETTERRHFIPFSLDYLKKEFAAFAENNEIAMFFAKHAEEVIAGAIIVFCGDSAFYHHGASSLKCQKIPAAYLLQWEIIKEAKRRGLKFYNFWGIAKQNQKPKIKNQKEHPWAGLTLFKTGFGGFQKDYLHARDLPLNYRYWFNYLIEIIRRKKRGL